MEKWLIAISILLSSISLLDAKGTDKSCTDIPAGIFQCNPYQFNFIKVQKLHEHNKTKLVFNKLKPLPQKNSKKTSMADLIEKHIKINEPIRYQGQEKNITNITNEELHHYISLAKQLKRQREALIAKILKEQAIQFEKQQLILKEDQYQKALKIIKAKQKSQYGYYKVKKGDTLSHIAFMFGLDTKELVKLNDLNASKPIKIDQNITLPFKQEQIEAISNALHIVKQGDTLSSIANIYDLKLDELIKFNKFNKDHILKIGEKIKLPLPYKLVELDKKIKTKIKVKSKKFIKKRKKIQRYGFFYKHKLRVVATAYTSHLGQTDDTPFLAAWNNRIRPGMKIIAVSRDLLYKYGMKNGTKVKISGLSGYYTVRDKMNKRYKRRIDIYMGTNRQKALRWGRRSVVIYW
jgi:LysM repeat protein/3D (Asp-Asp-Asp) domain-containing protein